MFRSTDAGAAWSPINDGLVRRLGDFQVFRLDVAKARPHSLYAVATSRVLAIRFDP